MIDPLGGIFAFFGLITADKIGQYKAKQAHLNTHNPFMLSLTETLNQEK